MGLFDFLRRSTGGARTASAAMPSELVGEGKFTLAVKGEASYRSNFERICGRHEDGVHDKVVTAVLVCEDDNRYDRNAVRIDVEGLTVGYLSRAMAVKYRDRLGALKRDLTPKSCQGTVRGGWNRGGDDYGEFGIWLDLDLRKTRRRNDA